MAVSRRRNPFTIQFTIDFGAGAEEEIVANEIRATAAITFAKGSILSIGRSHSNFSVTVTGDQYIAHVQPIGVTEEALDTGELGAGILGYAWFKNVEVAATPSPVIYVRNGSGNTNFMKLGPGQAALLPLAQDASPAQTYYAIADVAGSRLEYMIVEV